MGQLTPSHTPPHPQPGPKPPPPGPSSTASPEARVAAGLTSLRAAPGGFPGPGAGDGGRRGRGRCSVEEKGGREGERTDGDTGGKPSPAAGCAFRAAGLRRGCRAKNKGKGGLAGGAWPWRAGAGGEERGGGGGGERTPLREERGRAAEVRGLPPPVGFNPSRGSTRGGCPCPPPGSPAGSLRSHRPVANRPSPVLYSPSPAELLGEICRKPSPAPAVLALNRFYLFPAGRGNGWRRG